MPDLPHPTTRPLLDAYCTTTLLDPGVIERIIQLLINTDEWDGGTLDDIAFLVLPQSNCQYLVHDDAGLRGWFPCEMARHPAQPFCPTHNTTPPEVSP